MTTVTKGNLINGTYALMRISGLTVQPSPEDLEVALQVADDYAAELKPTLDIGWQYPADYGQSDPSDNSGLSKELAGPFKKMLALELVSYFGKQVTPTLAKIAEQGMASMEHLIVNIAPAEFPSTLPYGSGNEYSGYRDRTFYSEPPDNDGAVYVYKDDILNLSVDFTDHPNWLIDDVLDTVTWETDDTGVSIASESNDNTTASAELTFTQVGGKAIKIIVTKVASTDRLTEVRRFIVEEA